MCICINCRHVNNCYTYQIIQKQHQQNLQKLFTFIPSNTLINVNIASEIQVTNFDWDLVECLSFVEQPGQWLLDL